MKIKDLDTPMFTTIGTVFIGVVCLLFGVVFGLMI
tara:strand:- start:433 stop:537 length:105 start_codon:yes stop_codon:yes gene_type:complete